MMKKMMPKTTDGLPPFVSQILPVSGLVKSVASDWRATVKPTTGVLNPRVL